MQKGRREVSAQPHSVVSPHLRDLLLDGIEVFALDGVILVPGL